MIIFRLVVHFLFFSFDLNCPEILKDGTSSYCPQTIAAILYFVRQNPGKDIKVVTPYSAQRDRLILLGIDALTFASCQGSDCKILIVDFLGRWSPGFSAYSSKNVRVALTRGKQMMIFTTNSINLWQYKNYDQDDNLGFFQVREYWDKKIPLKVPPNSTINQYNSYRRSRLKYVDSVAAFAAVRKFYEQSSDFKVPKKFIDDYCAKQSNKEIEFEIRLDSDEDSGDDFIPPSKSPDFDAVPDDYWEAMVKGAEIEHTRKHRDDCDLDPVEGLESLLESSRDYQCEYLELNHAEREEMFFEAESEVKDFIARQEPKHLTSGLRPRLKFGSKDIIPIESIVSVEKK